MSTFQARTSVLNKKLYLFLCDSIALKQLLIRILMSRLAGTLLDRRLSF